MKKSCYTSRTTKTDARNKEIKALFEIRMQELKQEKYTVRTKIDIGFTELSERFYISKETVRQIVTGYQKYKRVKAQDVQVSQVA